MSWEIGADLLGPCFQTLFQSKEVPFWIFLGSGPLKTFGVGARNSFLDRKGLKTAGPDRHHPSGDREDQRIRTTREGERGNRLFLSTLPPSFGLLHNSVFFSVGVFQLFPHCVFTVYLCIFTIPLSSIF